MHADANVDMSKDPVLKDIASAAFKILVVGGHRIGLIGATTKGTPFISSPDKSIAFVDPVAAAQKAVGTSGVDVNVDGLSHTLLGPECKAEGLSPMGEYPTVVKGASGGTTRVTFKASGAEVLGIFEDGIDYGLSKYGDSPANPLLYVSGVKLSVSPAEPKGSRLSDVKVQGSDGSWVELDPSASYTMVVNGFMAAGGDRYDAVKSIAGRTLVNDEERIELIK
jgi:2',3'-cyclic-nucleotide 2'-phosphodiesterase (5'-nucleotidase family)